MRITQRNLICCLMVAVPLALDSSLHAGEIHAGASGIEVSAVECLNRTTGTSVRSADASTEWECGELGLVFESRDKVLLKVRGRVPGAVSGVGGVTSVAPLFVTTEIFGESDNPYDVADFDLDGDLDILTSKDALWLEHIPGAPPSFVPHELEEPPGLSFVTSLATADFNGDGRPDTAFVFLEDKVIWWHENLGGDPPQFEAHTLFREAGWRPFDIYVGDVDNDGDPDLLSFRVELGDIDPVRRRLAWHEYDDGSFTTHEIYQKESSFLGGGFGSFVADLDHDGDADIALNDSVDDNRIVWLESDGATTPEFELHVIDDDSPPSSGMDAVDLDLDGDLDLVTEISSDELRIYENLRGHPLQFARHDLIIDSSGRLLGDLNGDGRVDIVSRADFPDIGLRWHENVGGLSFIAHDVQVADDPKTLSSGVLADIDGNGDLDMIVQSDTFMGPTLRIEAKREAGMWSVGLEVGGVECRNLTSGQTVRDSAPDGRIFNCEELGLDVGPGDVVQMTVRGVAD